MESIKSYHSDMPTITYLTDNKHVEASDGESLLDTSNRLGIPHTQVCGAIARCSTCRVMILEGLDNCSPRNVREQLLADRLHLGADIRLACQTTISGPVTLRRLVLDAADIELTSQLNPDKTPISAGEEKKIAILFADIRQFTPFSEALPPYDVIHILNRYFQEMGSVIKQNRGVINNYMGDGLMALFGVDQPENATLNAVKAGLGMLEAVERLKSYLLNIYGMSFDIGVGVNYGNVVLGRVGAKDQRRMTAIGDAVNFASRIEEANKEYGSHLLISAQAYGEVMQQAQTGRQFNEVALKGKSGSYQLLEITGINIK